MWQKHREIIWIKKKERSSYSAVWCEIMVCFHAKWIFRILNKFLILTWPPTPKPFIIFKRFYIKNTIELDSNEKNKFSLGENPIECEPIVIMAKQKLSKLTFHWRRDSACLVEKTFFMWMIVKYESNPKIFTSKRYQVRIYSR